MRALPLMLENPEPDFQGSICPSIKTVSVCVLVANKSVLLLHLPGTAGSKQTLLEGSIVEQLSVAPIFLAGNFLPSFKPKRILLVPRNLLQEELMCFLEDLA